MRKADMGTQFGSPRLWDEGRDAEWSRRGGRARGAQLVAEPGCCPDSGLTSTPPPPREGEAET